MTKRILLIGLDPDRVDFSAPGTPPGVDAKMVHRALQIGNTRMEEKGLAFDTVLIAQDERNADAVIEQLSKSTYAVVVIGGGLRKPDAGVALFEQVINAVLAHAPQVKIAFNTNPTDSADAALRWL